MDGSGDPFISTTTSSPVSWPIASVSSRVGDLLPALLWKLDAEVEAPQLGKRHLGHGTTAIANPVDPVIVDYDDSAITREMDVALKGVSAKLRRLTE